MVDQKHTPHVVKSIDGIKRGPFLKDVYVQKRPLNATRTRLVSIQPTQRRQQTFSGQTLSPVLPSRPSAPRVTQEEKPKTLSPRDVTDRLHSKELVVKLPYGRSLRASLRLVVQYILIAVVAVSAAYSTSIGQWFVVALAAYVLIRRRDSQFTYAIALFILVTVPFFQLLGQGGVANNMAVYVFELLILGVLQSLIELKWPKWVVSRS